MQLGIWSIWSCLFLPLSETGHVDWWEHMMEIQRMITLHLVRIFSSKLSLNFMISGAITFRGILLLFKPKKNESDKLVLGISRWLSLADVFPGWSTRPKLLYPDHPRPQVSMTERSYARLLCGYVSFLAFIILLFLCKIFCVHVQTFIRSSWDFRASKCSHAFKVRQTAITHNWYNWN